MKNEHQDKSGGSVHYNLTAFDGFDGRDPKRDHLWVSGGTFSPNPGRHCLKSIRMFWLRNGKPQPIFAYQGENRDMEFYCLSGDSESQSAMYSVVGCHTTQMLVPSYLIWDGFVDKAHEETYKNTMHHISPEKDEYGVRHMPHGGGGLLSTSFDRKSIESWASQWNSFAAKRAQGILISVHMVPTPLRCAHPGDYSILRVETGIYGDYFMARLQQRVLEYRRLSGESKYCSAFIS